MDTPTTESLEQLAARGWLRELARSLVGDPHLAEDLAQDAALATLEAPRPPRDARAWLRGVTRILARNLLRHGARVARREAAASPRRAEPAPDELAQRLERHRELVEEVQALAEPYRSAVLLRFFEGLPQREIARRLEVPVATVNSRLTRALAQLHERLDRRHGDRSAWVAQLLPLALAQRVGTITLGGLVVKTQTLALAGVLAFLVLVPVSWFLFVRGGGSSADSKPDRSTIASREEVGTAAAERVREAGAPKPIKAVPFRSEGKSTAAGPTVELQILMSDGTAPAAGAELWVLDFERFLRQAAYRDVIMSGAVDQVALLERFGAHSVASDAGRIAIPAPGSDSGFLARCGSEAFIDQPVPEGVPGTIVLRPIVTVDVEVVNTEGAARGGIPVAFRERGRDVQLAITDSEGHVTLTRVRRAAPWSQRVLVALALPLAKPVEAPIDFDHPPEHPVRLVCPPTGRVVVTVTTLAGTPLPDGTRVALAPQRPVRGEVGVAPGGEVEEPPPDPQQLATAAVLGRQLKDGRATFVPVGVGATVYAAILIGDDGRMIAVSGPGPQSAGATAELELVVGAVPCHVHMTLHEADGSPLAETHVKSMFVADSPTNDVRFVLSMTDTRGRVTFTFTNDPAAPLGGPVKVARAATRLVPGGDPGTVDPGTVAGAFLDVAPGTTEIDLGTFTLGAPHVLVSGIVVGRDGSPVAGAVVRLVVPKISPSGEKSWAHHGNLRAVCDSAGRFSLKGVHQGGEPLWVTATAKGSWRHEPIALQPGAEVRLVLEPRPTLRGRLLLDPDVPASCLSVAAWPQSRGAAGYFFAGGWKHAARAEDGTFTVSHLEPGLYTLGIAAGLYSDVLYVKDVRVAADSTHLDPRLDPLDLRGRYQVIRLTVRDENGRHLDAEVLAFPKGGGGLSAVGSSRGPLLLSGPTRSLVIAAPGYFARVITPEDADHDIILSRGIPLTLKLDGLMPLPASDLSLEFRLEPTTSRPVSSDRSALDYAANRSPHHAPLRSDGTVSLRVPALGSYRLHLEARRDREGYVSILDLTPPDPFAFHLHEPGETVTVPLDGPTLRERIATWAAALPER